MTLEIRTINWREIVEIIGVISIVAALLIVAWELKQANHIARAEVELQLATASNDIHIARYTNPEFAQLFPKIENPSKHLITATDTSRIEALSWHLSNVYRAAQIAYDNGLLDKNGLDQYQGDIEWALEHWPGLREHLVSLYETVPAVRRSEIFSPVGSHIDEASKTE